MDHTVLVETVHDEDVGEALGQVKEQGEGGVGAERLVYKILC